MSPPRKDWISECFLRKKRNVYISISLLRYHPDGYSSEFTFEFRPWWLQLKFHFWVSALILNSSTVSNDSCGSHETIHNTVLEHLNTGAQNFVEPVSKSSCRPFDISTITVLTSFWLPWTLEIHALNRTYSFTDANTPHAVLNFSTLLEESPISRWTAKWKIATFAKVPWKPHQHPATRSVQARTQSHLEKHDINLSFHSVLNPNRSNR